MRTLDLVRVTAVVTVAMWAHTSFAAEFQGEVMTLKGTAQVLHKDMSEQTSLKEGDLLEAGDRVEVGSGSFVDIAYDKEWNNITRLGENSKTEILAIFPTGLQLDRGSVYAKLGKLPKGTTFEIHTPTAVAAARGTEFLVDVDEKGITDVIGFENKVEVFSLDARGNLGQAVVVESGQKTEVSGVDQPPTPPEKVAAGEFKHVKTMSGELDKSTQEMEKESREGRVQSVGSVEAFNTLSNFYLPHAERSTTEDDKGTSGLKDEQVAALKEQFIKMGGDPEQFDKFKDDFKPVDPTTFDQRSDQFNTGDYSPTNPPPPPSTTGDGNVPPPPPSGSGTTGGTGSTVGEPGNNFPPPPPPTGSAGPDGPNGPPPPPNFFPPDTSTIEQNMNQTQQHINQTTSNLPPPPPPPDKPPCPSGSTTAC